MGEKGWIAARISVRAEALSPFGSSAVSGADGDVRCEAPAEASALFLHAVRQQARARANQTRHERPDTMARRQFHLSWFLSQGYGPKTWRRNLPVRDVARWMMPDPFPYLAPRLRPPPYHL